MNKFFVAVLVLVVGITAGVLYSNEKRNVVDTSPKKEGISTVENKASIIDSFSLDGIVYYYGEECPHCKEVMEYLEENRVAEKVDFVKKEIWHNKENKEEFEKAVKKCGMDPRNAGVPFVYYNGKCFMGGPKVRNFFEQELKK